MHVRGLRAMPTRSARMERTRDSVIRTAAVLIPIRKSIVCGVDSMVNPAARPAAETSGAAQGARCAVVSVRTTRGSAQRVRMPLPVLGAGTAEALADAIERELDAGRALNIGGLDGMALRISPEDGLRRLIVAGCDR